MLNRGRIGDIWGDIGSPCKLLMKYGLQELYSMLGNLCDFLLMKNSREAISLTKIQIISIILINIVFLSSK